jgi:hypothetical protein
MPASDDWYYWFNKGKREKGVNRYVSKVVKDTEQGIYVRAGSIIPILRNNNNRESITTAVTDDGTI